MSDDGEWIPVKSVDELKVGDAVKHTPLPDDCQKTHIGNVMFLEDCIHGCGDPSCFVHGVLHLGQRVHSKVVFTFSCNPPGHGMCGEILEKHSSPNPRLFRLKPDENQEEQVAKKKLVTTE